MAFGLHGRSPRDDVRNCTFICIDLVTGGPVSYNLVFILNFPNRTLQYHQSRTPIIHHGGAAGGLALSVLSVMHKDSRSRKSLAIRQDLFIAGYGLGTAINTLSKRTVPQI